MIRKTVLITIGLAAVTFLFLRAVGAGEPEPPPEGFKPKGPAVIGTVIVTQSLDAVGDPAPPFVDIMFTGRCKGIDIIENLTGIPLGTVATATKDSLTGFFLGGLGNLVAIATDGACATSPEFSPDLVVQAVHNFENTGEMVTADVVMLFML